MTASLADAPAPVAPPADLRADPARAARLAVLYRVGLVLLGLQLVLMGAWSAQLVSRYALTFDFGDFYRILHAFWAAHLNPLDPTADRWAQDNLDSFVMWPVAVITSAYRHPVSLMWAQDLAVVGSELVVWRWVNDEVSARPPAGPWADIVPLATAAVLLAGNVWLYWAVSFDVHIEPFGLFFAALAARALWERRWRALVLWSAGVLLCGYVTATYLIGLGLVALLLRGRRGAGVALVVAAVGFVVAADLTHLAHTFGYVFGTGYGYLSGQPHPARAGTATVAAHVLTHPGRGLSALWNRRLDLWAALAPSGLVGFVWPGLAGLAVVVVPSNFLNASIAFAAPSFQNLPVYVATPAGTAIILAWAMRRPASARWARALRRGAVVLAVVVVADCLGWAAWWGPQLRPTWLRVSPGASAVLHQADLLTGPNDEVVVSQGVAGAFTDRADWYAIQAVGQAVPIDRPTVWFVLAPAVGIETAPSLDGFAIVDLMGLLPGNQLLLSRAGVWVFRWHPPRGTTGVSLRFPAPALPAWPFVAGAGSVYERVPMFQWFVTSYGRSGYVADGDYWRLPPGRYRAIFHMYSNRPAAAEVWDSSTRTLLVRRQVVADNGFEYLDVDFRVTRQGAEEPVSGSGPFRIHPVPANPFDQIELRVWVPAGVLVGVVDLQVAKA